MESAKLLGAQEVQAVSMGITSVTVVADVTSMVVEGIKVSVSVVISKMVERRVASI
jgi:hypothetical protein